MCAVRSAQIRAEQKLVVSGDTVRVDEPGVLGGLSRWLNSQVRIPSSANRKIFH